MTPEARAREAGFSPADVIAILGHAGRKAPEARLQARYKRTAWFRELTRQVLEFHESCVLCGSMSHPVVHHRHYRSLFNEDPIRDVTRLCQRCHGHYHRGARR